MEPAPGKLYHVYWLKKEYAEKDNVYSDSYTYERTTEKDYDNWIYVLDSNMGIYP
jgi:hypothetical protein